MKSAVFREFGAPERVLVEEVPTPTAGPGEALIRVRACALNHLDLWVLGGLPALKTPLPFWTGCDIVGDVAALGPGVTGPAPGTRVAVNPSLSCGVGEGGGKGEDSMGVSFPSPGGHVV